MYCTAIYIGFVKKTLYNYNTCTIIVIFMIIEFDFKKRLDCLYASLGIVMGLQGNKYDSFSIISSCHGATKNLQACLSR